MTPAEESGSLLATGAEGATAPETLRPMDREGDDTLESGDCLNGSAHRRG